MHQYSVKKAPEETKKNSLPEKLKFLGGLREGNGISNRNPENCTLTREAL
jgi:hypothetical protein